MLTNSVLSPTLLIISFIIGVLFVVLFLPVIQSIADILCNFGQWLLSFISVHIAINNEKVREIQASGEESNTNAIGFEAPLNDSDYDYDDDDEDYNKLKIRNESKNPIGFRG